MSVETLGKESAAEFEHEKDKYTVLKCKFYELDEKVRVGDNACHLFFADVSLLSPELFRRKEQN